MYCEVLGNTRRALGGVLVVLGGTGRDLGSTRGHWEVIKGL